ncbi:glycosyltransferase [Cerasicoccus arenae]|uniref:Uncharacterized protein n=1 Tax=Cerasicoccus arenae TaxID=424488 RepID=A0A8J3GFA3_9BACT|nr:glycosyltransferase [Cerasicoccus arenae]MBK1858653.1 glycosyltransferase [Cerasicoccus arenae]GHC04779.1 hypothetical protein GCM10007047_22010 [Cerasicoccus arenae]
MIANKTDKRVMPSVAYHYRQEGCAFSLEQVFSDVRGALSEGIQQEAFYCPHRRASPSAMWANVRQARRSQCVVNHITGEVHYLALALPRRGLVLTIHDSGDTNAFRGWKQAIFRCLWYTWPIRRAAAVTFISTFARESVESLVGFPIKHAWVIPDPVSARFVYSPKVFPESNPRVLCLGTKTNKNIERLAEAVGGLPVELRIIGQLSESQNAALAKHGVRYTTAAKLTADEIFEEYQAADIVSLVSTFEGFGLPIVEGQAIGRPVITSNTCAMPETAGEGALLVDPMSVDDIREGMKRLLAEPSLRADLIEKGLANAQRFTASSVARQYEAVYAAIA